MNITRSMTLMGTVLVAAAGGALAADATQGLYLTADAGGIFQQDADFKQTLSPTFNAAFNPGLRTDLAIGYNLTPSFALEIEPGFMWNSVDTLNGHSMYPGESIDLYSVPILANAIYRFPTVSGWTPYVGAGIGANIGIFDGSLPGGTYTDTDISFAFQAEAGVKYALTDNASVGVAYKFLGTTDQDYRLQISPQYTDHATLSGIYIHGIFVNFTTTF